MYAPFLKNRPKKRVGRGGKRGTTAGRGTKGQKARAGSHMRPAIRDILKKIPKRRGYRQKQIPSNLLTVGLNTVINNFAPGEIVSPKTLAAKRLVRKVSGKPPRVKILGREEMTKPLVFQNVIFSKSARETVAKSGSTVKE